MAEIEVRSKLICFTLKDNIVYRVNVRKNLLDSVPKLRELLDTKRVGVCMWEECFVTTVFKQPYTYKGEKKFVYYITIPKRIVEEYEIMCGDDVVLRVVVPEGGEGGRADLREDHEDTKEQ